MFEKFRISILLSTILFCFSKNIFADESSKTSIDSFDSHYLLKDFDQENAKPSRLKVFELDGGVKLRVKKKTFNEPERDSLIVSYITSRLLQYIVPGQVATVVVVMSEEGAMIGSYDIPGFEGKGYWPVNGTKNGALLNLALYLMDIADKHAGNVGLVANDDGTKKVVVVDMDRMDGFKNDWLFTSNSSVGEQSPEFRQALGQMASISESDIKKIFLMAVDELEKVLLFPNPSSSKLNMHYDIDFILSKVLERKDEMKWAYAHLDIIGLSKEDFKLKESDIKDDRFGFFLMQAAQYNKLEIAKELIANGSKDPFGMALERAVENNNLEMVDLLTTHGAKDLDGKTLKKAVEDNHVELVKLLLACGAKITHGLVFEAVQNRNKEILKLLLDHGAKDQDVIALGYAVDECNLDLVKLLLDHGSKDPEALVLEHARSRHCDKEIIHLLEAVQGH